MMNKFINKKMFILIFMFILLLIPTLSKAVLFNYSDLKNSSNRLFCVQYGGYLDNSYSFTIGKRLSPKFETEWVRSRTSTSCNGKKSRYQYTGEGNTTYISDTKRYVGYGPKCDSYSKHVSLDKAGKNHGYYTENLSTHQSGYEEIDITSSIDTKFNYYVQATLNIGSNLRRNDLSIAQKLNDANTVNGINGGNNSSIAQMAYIIANSYINRTYYYGNFYGHYSKYQMAVYRKFTPFISLTPYARGWAHSTSQSFGTDSDWANDVIAGAQNYAANLAKWKQLGGVFSSTSPTTNGTVVTKLKNINGTSYLVAGPFNWNFTGTIGSLNVKNVNGVTINNVRYANSNLNIINSIPSNSNFYLLLPVNSGAKEIVISGTIINNMRLYYGTIELLQSSPQSSTVKDRRYNI